MNKKLRLLVTTRCPNKCPMCCNNSWDFDKLPVVDRWNYEEIMITGGEPLLFNNSLLGLVLSIEDITKVMGNSPKIFIYTSVCDYEKVLNILPHISGIVLTPHKESDIEDFIQLNDFLGLRKNYFYVENTSLRLNLFPDMKALLPKDIDLSLWQVKDMEWKKDCPVPEGEDFRRIANLW